MRIHRILNNNAVIILDENGREKIICGIGIAFGKSRGDAIEEKEIKKVFVIQNNDMSIKFQQLISDIPLKHIQVAGDIIDYAKLHLGKKLNENLIISLSDHIYTSLKRYQEGIQLHNALLWDIQHFYHDEFDVATMAVDMIYEHFGVKLPDDEIGFIATHLINAEMTGDTTSNIAEITKLMQEVLNIVKYFFKIELNNESVYHYRFLTHLKFFSHRILSGRQYQDAGDDLLNILRNKYQNSFECVNMIAKYINNNYAYELSGEEQSYLLIHINRLIYSDK